MGIIDFFRRNSTATDEDFLVSSGERKPDRFLVAMEKAFEPENGKKGQKKTTSEASFIKRIEPKQLELAYMMDEMVFRCTNFFATQVVGPGYDLVGSEENVKVVKDFFVKTFMNLQLEQMVRDSCNFGFGALEKVFNADDTIMTNLSRIDPKYFDFKKTSFNVPKEDSEGNIVGYTFTTLAGTKIDLIPNEIAYFPLFEMGNDRPLGYVEPLYRLVVDKLNTRAGFKESNWRMGYPLTVFYVGDKPDAKSGYTGHKSTTKIVNKLITETENLQAKHKLILPNWVKAEQMKSEKIETPVLLEYFDTRILATYGLPLDLVLGKGSKATLDVAMKRDLDRRIRWHQNKLSIVCERSVIPQILEQNGLKGEVKMRWKDVTPEDLNRMAKRYVEYIQCGIMKPEHARKIIYEIEGISLEETLEKLEEGEISQEEAIIVLKRIAKAFPSQETEIFVNKLIDKIMLKSTKVNKPIDDSVNEGDSISEEDDTDGDSG